MLRAFVLGSFAVACGATGLFAGCSKSEATPPVVTANAKAGIVIDVTGKVTATRGGVARDLAKGAEVFGDDVIATPADGSIAIELAHNNARWNLGASKSGKVSESVAWTLPKAEAIAGSVEGDSSAAGRHAERSSVETAASAAKDGAANADPKLDQQKPSGGEGGPGGTAGSAATTGSPGTTGTTGKGGPTKITTKTTTKGGGSTGTKTKDKDSIGDDDAVGGLGLKGTGPGGGGTGDGIGLGGIGTIGHGGGTGVGTGYGTGGGKLGGSHTAKAPKLTTGTTTVSGKLPPEVVQRIVRAHFGQFRFCYETALKKDPNVAGKVEVKFVIGRDGTVSTASATGVNDELDACVAMKFKALAFPVPEEGIVTVVYPIVFAPE